MRLWKAAAIVLFLMPTVASAQGFKDLDEAMSAITQAFSAGEPRAVVIGIGDGEQVNLVFPGIVEEAGFYGRDQAQYYLEKLFGKVKSREFRQERVRKVSSESQYHIVGRWTVSRGEREEARSLYIVLKSANNAFTIVSIRSADQ